jgi:orotate phosphoribosyltransferase
MNPSDPRRLLEQTGAIRSGNFLLSSGRHSDVYVEKARLLERPDAVGAIAGELASWHPGVEVVLSPAVGAIVLGFAVASAAGARFVFAEREADRLALRRGFRIEPGERTLVVEDVVTTGASARETWNLARDAGAVALGVAAVVDRSQSDPGFPLRALVRIHAQSWIASACPQCARGEELDSPGSRHLLSKAERSPSSRG